MVFGKVKLIIRVRMMLVLKYIYIVVKRVAALERGGGIEVVGKAIIAIKVVVCILVMAEVYSLKAVSEVSKVSKV